MQPNVPTGGGTTTPPTQRSGGETTPTHRSPSPPHARGVHMSPPREQGLRMSSPPRDKRLTLHSLGGDRERSRGRRSSDLASTTSRAPSDLQPPSPSSAGGSSVATSCFASASSGSTHQSLFIEELPPMEESVDVEQAPLTEQALERVSPAPSGSELSPSSHRITSSTSTPDTATMDEAPEETILAGAAEERHTAGQAAEQVGRMLRDDRIEVLRGDLRDERLISAQRIAELTRDVSAVRDTTTETLRSVLNLGTSVTEVGTSVVEARTSVAGVAGSVANLETSMQRVEESMAKHASDQRDLLVQSVANLTSSMAEHAKNQSELIRAGVGSVEESLGRQSTASRESLGRQSTASRESLGGASSVGSFAFRPSASTTQLPPGFEGGERSRDQQTVETTMQVAETPPGVPSTSTQVDQPRLSYGLGVGESEGSEGGVVLPPPRGAAAQGGEATHTPGLGGSTESQAGGEGNRPLGGQAGPSQGGQEGPFQEGQAGSQAQGIEGLDATQAGGGGGGGGGEVVAEVVSPAEIPSQAPSEEPLVVQEVGEVGAGDVATVSGGTNLVWVRDRHMITLGFQGTATVKERGRPRFKLGFHLDLRGAAQARSPLIANGRGRSNRLEAHFCGGGVQYEWGKINPTSEGGYKFRRFSGSLPVLRGDEAHTGISLNQVVRAVPVLRRTNLNPRLKLQGGNVEPYVLYIPKQGFKFGAGIGPFRSSLKLSDLWYIPDIRVVGNFILGRREDDRQVPPVYNLLPQDVAKGKEEVAIQRLTRRVEEVGSEVSRIGKEQRAAFFGSAPSLPQRLFRRGTGRKGVVRQIEELAMSARDERRDIKNMVEKGFKESEECCNQQRAAIGQVDRRLQQGVPSFPTMVGSGIRSLAERQVASVAIVSFLLVMVVLAATSKATKYSLKTSYDVMRGLVKAASSSVRRGDRQEPSSPDRQEPSPPDRQERGDTTEEDLNGSEDE